MAMEVLTPMSEPLISPCSTTASISPLSIRKHSGSNLPLISHGAINPISKSISYAAVGELFHHAADANATTGLTYPAQKSSTSISSNLNERPVGWYASRKAYRSVAYRTWTVGNARRLLSCQSDCHLNTSVCSSVSDNETDHQDNTSNQVSLFAEPEMNGNVAETNGYHSEDLLTDGFLDDDDADVRQADRRAVSETPRILRSRSNTPANANSICSTSLHNGSHALANGISHGKPPVHPKRNGLMNGSALFNGSHSNGASKHPLKSKNSYNSSTSAGSSFDSCSENASDCYSASEYKKFCQKMTASITRQKKKPKIPEPVYSNGGFHNGFVPPPKLTNGFALANGNGVFAAKSNGTTNGLNGFTEPVPTLKKSAAENGQPAEGLISGFRSWRKSFSSRKFKPENTSKLISCISSPILVNVNAAPSLSQPVTPSPQPSASNHLESEESSLSSLSKNSPVSITGSENLDHPNEVSSPLRMSSGSMVASMNIPPGPPALNSAQVASRFCSYVDALEYVKQEMMSIRCKDFAILRQLCRLDYEISKLRENAQSYPNGIDDSSPDSDDYAIQRSSSLPREFENPFYDARLPPFPKCLQLATTSV